MTHDILRRFIERVRQTHRSQSKQIIIPVHEAQDVANALSDLLLTQNDLQQQIIKLQNTNSIFDISVIGGSFK